jgi:hypothetical protein
MKGGNVVGLVPLKKFKLVFLGDQSGNEMIMLCLC